MLIPDVVRERIDAEQARRDDASCLFGVPCGCPSTSRAQGRCTSCTTAATAGTCCLKGELDRRCFQHGRDVCCELRLGA
jgi:hypothetical protein